MDITKDTKVADILTRYGDLAEVMEVLGVKRIGRFSVEEAGAAAREPRP